MGDYEQKYKKALERAKTVITLTSSDEAVGAAITIFPELKESGDEGIRKALIQHIKDKVSVISGWRKEELISWLEKQKPVKLNEEDEKIAKELIDYLKSRIVISDENDILFIKKWISWLEKQKPVEWSEEDDDMVKETIYFINEFQKSDRCKDENDMQNSVTCENWLKTLKERVQPQPKQEWSEEDEKMKSLIISTLTSMGTLNLERYHNMNLDEVKNWLKSLKHHWKPTKEQIEALKYVVDYFGELTEHFAEYDEIKSLYDDLKNL